MDTSQKSSSGASGISGWIARPFNEDMDALHWVLFLGFAIIVAFLWRGVLSHIVEAV